MAHREVTPSHGVFLFFWSDPSFSLDKVNIQAVIIRSNFRLARRRQILTVGLEKKSPNWQNTVYDTTLFLNQLIGSSRDAALKVLARGERLPLSS